MPVENKENREQNGIASTIPDGGLTYGVAVPEYLGGLELAGVLLAADVVILADTLQYSRQSRQNRGRIRTPDGAVWLSVPLLGGQYGRAICETVVDDRTPWRKHHRKALVFNYRSTPYFDHYEEHILSPIVAENATLAGITVASVGALCRVIGSRTTVLSSSSLIQNDEHPSNRSKDFPASLAHVLGQVPAGADLIVPGSIREAVAFALTGIDRSPVMRLDVSVEQYPQNFDGFVAGLSAIDLVSNVGPEAADMIRAGIRVDQLAHP